MRLRQSGDALEKRGTARILGLSASDRDTNLLHAFSVTAPNQSPPCVYNFRIRAAGANSSTRMIRKVEIAASLSQTGHR